MHFDAVERRVRVKGAMFGFDLLNWLIEKRPEAKEAIQAMQKLKVEGLA